MVDPISIAAAAVVSKAFAEGAAKEMGGAAARGIQTVLEEIRTIFGGAPDTIQAIEKQKTKTPSENNALELARIIEAQTKQNPEMREALRSAILDAGKSADTGSFITQVVNDARVGKITNIGSVQGNVTF